MSLRRAAMRGLVLGLAFGTGCNSGDGSGGRAVVRTESSPGCRVLSQSPFPVGLAWLPGGGGLAFGATFSPSAVIPLDVQGEAPRLARGVPTLAIPDDSDGDGLRERSGEPGAPLDFPQLDGLFVEDPALVAAGLGLLTASGYEEVIVFRPAEGRLAQVEVSVDASFAASDHRWLPEPGTSALRTAISTDACIRPAAPIDSFGNDYAGGRGFCDPDVPGSFYGIFTSGAAVASDRLFVSLSNLGDGGNTPFARYLPGAVLVYALDLASDPPRAEPEPLRPVIETRGFNPSHVTRYADGAREWILVTVSGAIGIEADDPSTPQIEQETLALTDGAIEVIDPETLALVGEIPLGPGALAFDRLAIDPTGRVAVVGSAVGREVYVVDLAPLSQGPVDPDALAEAAVFDAFAPLAVPALAGGPAAGACAPLTGGIAWNHAGDRLYVSERCDGSLTEFEVSLFEGPDGRIAPSSFTWRETRSLVSPLRADTLGDVRDPGVLRVRPGRPGVDFTGPDLLFLTSQPDGQACALRLESF
jgi:hypothetical protein